MLTTMLLRLTGLRASSRHSIMGPFMAALLRITSLVRLGLPVSVRLAPSWRSPCSVRGGSMHATTISAPAMPILRPSMPWLMRRALLRSQSFLPRVPPLPATRGRLPFALSPMAIWLFGPLLLLALQVARAVGRMSCRIHASPLLLSALRVARAGWGARYS